MKRNIVIAVALCLMMIATAGAGAASAKQENPRQAGKSSIYFYDVEQTETHGSGQLVIDLDKHSFVFIGKDFTPSARYSLRARAKDGTDYVFFASGKTTPSGNLHIAGTWVADAPPAEIALGSSTYDGAPLNSIRFENDGWFIAQIAFYYSTDDGVTWTETGHSDDITKNDRDFKNVRWVDLRDFGIPVGALVKFHAIVVAGKDRTSSEVFQHAYCCYEPGGCCWAGYHITGTTGDPHLYYEGRTCNACDADCGSDCNCPTIWCFE